MGRVRWESEVRCGSEMREWGVTCERERVCVCGREGVRLERARWKREGESEVRVWEDRKVRVGKVI